MNLISSYLVIPFQSISPGLVDTDIVSNSDNDIINYMPRLKPQDVSRAVLFAITNPENVQVRTNSNNA